MIAVPHAKTGNSLENKSTTFPKGRCFWFILAGAATLRLFFSFFHPFRADEFLHLHDIWLVSQGKLPYRDFFEHHACGYHYIMAPMCRLFSPEKNVTSAAGFVFFCRAVSWISGIIALYLLALLGRNWRGNLLGSMAVILICGVPFFLETSIETRPDVMAMALLLGCLGILTQELERKPFESGQDNPSKLKLPIQHSRVRLVSAGLCLGAGIMFTQKLLFVLPGIGVTWAIWIGAGGGTNFRWRSVAAIYFSVGFTLPVLIALCYFGIQGAGAAFVDKVFLINARWAYHNPPDDLLQMFWNESWLFTILGATGMFQIWVRMAVARKPDWTGVLVSAVVLGWLAGLLWVLPVADIQFFLIPLPLIALLASVTLKSFFEVFPKWSAVPIVAAAVVWATIPPLNILQGESEALRNLAGKPLPLALWAIQNTKSTDSVLDGWTGIGVFRPQAWYYGFIHNEIPPMIPPADRESLMHDLETGQTQPKIIANDNNLFSLNPSLWPWMTSHYTYNMEMGVFVRSEDKIEQSGDRPGPGPLMAPK